MRALYMAGKVFHHTQSKEEFVGWFPEIGIQLFDHIDPLDVIKVISGNMVFIYTAKK